MMVTSEDIVQGIRTWLLAEGDAAGLEDSQVIAARAKGPRPPLPYLAVRVNAADTPVGMDEDIRTVDDDGVPQFQARGVRTCVVSIQGYGTGADVWLIRATSRLRHPASRAVVDALGLTIDPRGGLADLSQLLDTSFEDRWLLECDVSYATITDPEAQVEAVNTEVATTLTGHTVPLIFTAQTG